MVVFLEAKRVLSCLPSLIWLMVLLISATSILPCNGGSITSSYVRKLEESEDMPYDSDVFRYPPGYNAPQQVHITQGDSEGRGVIVSWVTMDEAGSNKVIYWNEKSKKNKKEAEGYVTTYKYYNYTSGYIHHCTIKDLEFSSKYYYMVGTGNSSRTFWFKTPPPIGLDVPYTFGLIGDLGQTFDSNNTLTHYEQNPTKGQAVLYVGDLSYADEHPFSDNRKWDSWARFVERSVAYQPWIWTAGNHDIDYAPDLGETISFKPFTTRYPVPYNNAEGSSKLWYSIKRASAHIIVLSSYSACAKYTPQYMWLQKELEKVDRKVTPWLIVMMHSPLYNSYNYHYMEADTMRVVYESWFVQHKVDIVFAGHVHAYERSYRFSNVGYNLINRNCTPVKDLSAPVYITIGDGGNLEGLTTQLTEPQPNYSAFREPSYGHGILEIKNRTHAYFSWHRNHEGYAMKADSTWLFNRYWYPADDSNTS